MKKSIPLKEIVGFLPYGLKVKTSLRTRELVIGNEFIDINNETITVTQVISNSFHKPIVRPLSDLTKEITHNGETFVTLWKIFGTSFQLQEYKPCINIFNGHFRLSISNGIRTFNADLTQYEMLFEMHFDIYDWIKDDLAIDINTL